MKTKHLKTKLLSFVLFVFFSGIAEAQNAESYYLVSGIVRDSQSKKPIEYVNVSAKGTNVGTVTNADGKFVLKLQESLSVTEIELSYIGYFNTEISISKDMEQNQTYYITPRIEMLSGAAVFAKKDRKITVKDIELNLDDDKTIHNEIIKVLPRNAVYLFPEFMQGTVFFKNGMINSAKFNYNTLVSEMQFLDEQGNIFALANPKNVSHVIINHRFFYYVSKKKFAEILINHDNVKLLTIRQTKYGDKQEQTGAYGQSSPVFSVSPVSSLNMHILKGDPVHWTYGQKVSVHRNMQFEIVDEFLLEIDGKFTIISGQNSFIKAFPAFKNEIDKHVKSSNVNFKSETDLIELTKFCLQLSLLKKLGIFIPKSE